MSATQILLGSVLFPIIDTIWIGWLASDKYQQQIMQVQGTPLQVRQWPLPLIYLLIGIGIAYLVLPRIKPESEIKDAVFYGGLLGLVSYGLFDLTNIAVLKDWNVPLAAMDMAWGTFLTALVSYLVHRFTV